MKRNSAVINPLTGISFSPSYYTNDHLPQSSPHHFRSLEGSTPLSTPSNSAEKQLNQHTSVNESTDRESFESIHYSPGLRMNSIDPNLQVSSFESNGRSNRQDLCGEVHNDGIDPLDSISEVDPNELCDEDSNDSADEYTDSDDRSIDSYTREVMSAFSAKSNVSAGGKQWGTFRQLFDQVPLVIRSGAPSQEHMSVVDRLLEPSLTSHIESNPIDPCVLERITLFAQARVTLTWNEAQLRDAIRWMITAAIDGYSAAQLWGCDLAVQSFVTTEPGDYKIALSAPKPNLSVGIPVLEHGNLADGFSIKALQDILCSPIARDSAPFDRTTGSLYGCLTLWSAQVKREHTRQMLEVALNQNANMGVYKVGQRLQFLRKFGIGSQCGAQAVSKPYFISFRICGEIWYIDSVWYDPDIFRKNLMKHVELAKGDWAIDPKKFVAAIQIVHQISMESMAGEMQDAMSRVRATAIDDPAK